METETTQKEQMEMFHNTAKGASTSALVYSISETAKLDYLMPLSDEYP